MAFAILAVVDLITRASCPWGTAQVWGTWCSVGPYMTDKRLLFWDTQQRQATCLDSNGDVLGPITSLLVPFMLPSKIGDDVD
mmetsp:Transcript_33244/g.75966  ORF Transcript_33244/g.75966 Transcript_33244/m.75966 type:complete len:82 (-) Transcript_33244:404-649(-)